MNNELLTLRSVYIKRMIVTDSAKLGSEYTLNVYVEGVAAFLRAPACTCD